MSQPHDQLIREKILAGTLPKQNCHMTWYGPGTGGVCVACEQPIAPHEVEVGVRLARRWNDPAASRLLRRLGEGVADLRAVEGAG